jgi:hypothetical protein
VLQRYGNAKRERLCNDHIQFAAKPRCATIVAQMAQRQHYWLAARMRQEGIGFQQSGVSNTLLAP